MLKIHETQIKKVYLLSLIILISNACTKSSSFELRSTTSTQSFLETVPDPSGAKPSFSQLEQLIRNPANGIVDTASFLRFIKKDPYLKGFLKNPVLNQNSFALHKELVSPEFPRIILHLDDMMMMFIGNPNEKSSQFLEIIGFNPSTKKFVFQLINFLAKKDNKYIDAAFLEDAGEICGDFKPDVFSDETRCEAERVLATKHSSYVDKEGLPEAISCRTCHDLRHGGYELVPRWNTSVVWETPYAQIQGKLFEGSKAYSNWQNFLSGTMKSPDNSLYKIVGLPDTKELINSHGRKVITFTNRPNLSLAKHANSRNIQRIARLISTSSRYHSLQYAVMGALFDCKKISDFLPDSEIDLRVQRTLETSPILAPLEKTHIAVHKSSMQLKLFDTYARTTFASNRENPINTNTVFVDRNELLRFSIERDPVKNLRKWISRNNMKAVLSTISRGDDLAPLDFTGYALNQVDFSQLSIRKQAETLLFTDSLFESVLAKLFYVLYGELKEGVENWSIELPVPHTVSYRLSNGLEGPHILELGPKHLGPEFFKQNPDLAEYLPLLQKLQPSGFHSPKKDQFCSKLKNRSLKAFSVLKK